MQGGYREGPEIPNQKNIREGGTNNRFYACNRLRFGGGGRGKPFVSSIGHIQEAQAGERCEESSTSMVIECK